MRSGQEETQEREEGEMRDRGREGEQGEGCRLG